LRSSWPTFLGKSHSKSVTSWVRIDWLHFIIILIGYEIGLVGFDPVMSRFVVYLEDDGQWV